MREACEWELNAGPVGSWEKQDESLVSDVRSVAGMAERGMKPCTTEERCMQ
jgi:hypothetical protein